jgi:hypothetical protein
LSTLTLEQVDRLERNDRIVWSFLGDLRGKLICSLSSECFRQARIIAQLISENGHFRAESSRLCSELDSARSRLKMKLTAERDSFAVQRSVVVDHFEAKFDELREILCSEVPYLRDECSHVSIEESMKYLKSSEVSLDYEARSALKSSRRISGILRSWNLNRGSASLCEKFSEIKRIFPSVNTSKLLQALRPLCPDVPIQDVVECIHAVFPEVKTDEVIDLIGKFFSKTPIREIVTSIRRLCGDMKGPEVFCRIRKAFRKRKQMNYWT